MEGERICSQPEEKSFETRTRTNRHGIFCCSERRENLQHRQTDREEIEEREGEGGREARRQTRSSHIDDS